MIGSKYSKYTKKSAKAKAKAPAKRAVSVPLSVQKYVKRQLAKDEEDKYAVQLIPPDQLEPVLQVIVPGTFVYYTNQLATPLLITQGVGQGQRVGNELILKEWKIKGVIVNTFPGVGQPTALTNGQTYVDIYIGYLKNLGTVNTSLTDLYQYGGNALSPSGTISDILQTVNKDVYRVVYHKRFKMGAAANSIPVLNANTVTANNDFDLTRTFEFDIARNMRNHKIKYNDNNATPQDGLINAYTMWATCNNADGTLITNSVIGESVPQIAYQNYVKFTDA